MCEKHPEAPPTKRGDDCVQCVRDRASEWYYKNKQDASNPLAGRSSKFKTHCPAGHVHTQGKKCRECNKTRNANWRQRTYHVSPEKFIDMMEKQEGRCEICGKIMNPPCIDHDHSCCNRAGSCGKCIRGLLCHRCNVMLGGMENPHWKANAERYLAKYSTPQPKS